MPRRSPRSTTRTGAKALTARGKSRDAGPAARTPSSRSSPRSKVDAASAGRRPAGEGAPATPALRSVSATTGAVQPPGPPASNLPDEIRRIQKYPNRRLYDRTSSRHLTHEELYELVAAGQRVQVVDSRSGEDLTTVVLAQVLIEHDPLKFSAIPPELLHLLIRANRGVLPSLQRSMIEAMSGAAAGWIAWQERMASLFAPGAQRSIDWMMNSLGAAPSQPPVADATSLRAELATLREELAALREAGSAPPGRRRATGNARRGDSR